MAGLPLPATDPVSLADWVELTALTAGNRTATHSTLERALTAAGVIASSDDVERRVLSVFAELDSRSQAAGVGYAFEVAPPRIRVRRRAWKTASAYIFCLCLTRFGNKVTEGIYPTRIFELVAREAAKNYLGGEAIRFGSPRDPAEIDIGFRKAVGHVTQQLAEGDGYSGRPTHWRKDHGVDIVAWRHELDRRPGKLVLFGGCASGNDWKSKTAEVRPPEWYDLWVKGAPESQVVRAFFIPFRIADADYWSMLTIGAGIIFDRCRTARWAMSLPAGPYGDGVQWCRALLAKL